MKKLMMFVGAVLLATFAQAAVVQWGSGTYSNGFVGPDGSSLARSDAYTMIVTFYTDAAGSDILTTSSVTSAKPNGAFNAVTDDVFANGETYYVSAILKANDGSATWEAALSSFTTADNGDWTLNFTTGAGFDTAGQKWAAGGWQTSDVPEPTSGLLLVLGMAGLALRRRRA